ncbi:MAG: hypothetical protein ACREHE_12290 [Rhizomicrobium sp.]
MAAPLYFDFSKQYLGFFFYGGLGLTLPLLTNAFAIAFRGESARAKQGHRQRVMALVGMIIFGLAFTGCAAWYLWPTSPQTACRIPSGVSRLAIVGFNYPPLDVANPHSDHGLIVHYVNRGSIAADSPLLTARTFVGPANASTKSVIAKSKEEILALLPGAIEDVTAERTATQIDPGIEMAHSVHAAAITQADWNDITSGKSQALLVLILTYRDDSLIDKQFLITEFAGSISGNDAEFTVRYSRTCLHQ